MQPRTERNKLIMKLIDKGWSYDKVREEMGFKSKGTVWEIYKREKYGVRRHLKEKKKLSTGRYLLSTEITYIL
jgi:hypothetical protein